MQKFGMRQVGKTSLKLPPLGFGCVALGGAFRDIPEHEAAATVETAWDLGMRYFDTSPWYGRGQSEIRIGTMLRQKPREEWILSTKVGRIFRPFEGKDEDWDPDNFQSMKGLKFVQTYDYGYDAVMQSYWHSQLRMGMNHKIDALIIHDLDYKHFPTDAEFDAKMKELEGGMRALEELKSSGRIKAIGAGLNENKSVGKFNKAFDLDFMLIAMPYSLLDQEIIHNEFVDMEKKGTSIVLGSPYASGILATGPKPGARYNYLPASDDVLRRTTELQKCCESFGVPLKAAALQFVLGHP